MSKRSCGRACDEGEKGRTGRREEDAMEGGVEEQSLIYIHIERNKWNRVHRLKGVHVVWYMLGDNMTQ